MGLFRFIFRAFAAFDLFSIAIRLFFVAVFLLVMIALFAYSGTPLEWK